MALTDNIISYWKLEEASGTRYDAVVASANDLTDNNTVGQGTGIIGYGADLERDNTEYFSRTDASFAGFPTGSFSFSMWVKAESDPADGYDYGLVGKYAGSPNRSLYITYGQYTSKYYLGIAISSNGTTYGTNLDTLGLGSYRLVPGTWYHLAFVLTASSRCEIFVNGVSVVNTTSSVVSGMFNNAEDFRLGTYDGANGFDGLLDEVGLWNRQLTDAEITSLYNSGSGLQYPFVSGPAHITSINGVAVANITSVNGVALANITSINGVA